MKRVALLLTVLCCGIDGVIQAASISATGMQHYWGGTDRELDEGRARGPIASFDFTGQTPLTFIKSVIFTMTMFDGDTAWGDFDYRNVVLFLDQIQTPVWLNGFPDETTKTVTNRADVSPAVGGELMAALADLRIGAALGQVHINGHNRIEILDGYLAILTFSDTTAVPEPGSMCLAGVGAATALAWKTRRRKQRS